MDALKTVKTTARPIRRATLHHSAVAELRAMILDGELPPGVRVPEVQLCEQPVWTPRKARAWSAPERAGA